MSEENPTPQLIDNPQHDSGRVIKDLLAGTAGGIAQVLVGQPFDTTKVRLQTATTRTNAMEVVINLLKNEGPRGFYKGTLTPLVGVGACVSLQFGVNEAMKRFFHSLNDRKSETLSLTQYYFCGVTGGISNSFLASPIEHVRIRLQTQTGSGSNVQFKGPLDCIRQLKNAGGIMRGLTPTLFREGHGIGTYFLIYEALVANEINNGMKRNDISPLKLCLFGALSGTTLWLMVYPLDVIKSIMQTDNIKNPKFGKTMGSVAKTLYAKQGLGAFFRGFGPTILRAAPANGATFATFELAMRLLG
ncbi:organic acid transporter NDAI_0A05240 [Naumovozyma dairenensis CBS 421]|uniref:Carrier protein YMC1, mitochondrial n=1 Tax=Naumovozyma dairenensis (strain ATCC 10597 / BCRC 20456 / CBS 421 / NBRC 0211 / NRRL Y-12639) TaxID=1071378 RepID=G0W4E1_NAUDC|nr:hypothetical protein NDAI_0A05240 [Naumovozyma dairenensis CBS 421]CCD22679.1 hypothetical protein NDAI_0A05240 [Naumovozyma dairenensis CBS 421]